MVDHSIDESSVVTCPVGHEQDEAEAFLGQLGWLTHYRCRGCGLEWSSSPLSADIERVGQEIKS